MVKYRSSEQVKGSRIAACFTLDVRKMPGKMKAVESLQVVTPEGFGLSVKTEPTGEKTPVFFEGENCRILGEGGSILRLPPRSDA